VQEGENTSHEEGGDDEGQTEEGSSHEIKNKKKKKKRKSEKHKTSTQKKKSGKDDNEGANEDEGDGCMDDDVAVLAVGEDFIRQESVVNFTASIHGYMKESKSVANAIEKAKQLNEGSKTLLVSFNTLETELKRQLQEIAEQHKDHIGTVRGQELWRRTAIVLLISFYYAFRTKCVEASSWAKIHGSDISEATDNDIEHYHKETMVNLVLAVQVRSSPTRAIWYVLILLFTCCIKTSYFMNLLNPLYGRMKNAVNKALYDNLYKKAINSLLGKSVYQTAVFEKQRILKNPETCDGHGHPNEGQIFESSTDELGSGSSENAVIGELGSGNTVIESEPNQEGEPINLFSTASRFGTPFDIMMSQMAILQTDDLRSRYSLTEEEKQQDENERREQSDDSDDGVQRGELVDRPDPPLIYTVFDAHFESKALTIQAFYNESPGLLQKLSLCDHLSSDDVAKFATFFELTKDLVCSASVKIGKTTSDIDKLQTRYNTHVREATVKGFPFDNIDKDGLNLMEAHIHDLSAKHRVAGASSCFEGFHLFDPDGKFLKSFYNDMISCASTSKTISGGKVCTLDNMESSTIINGTAPTNTHRKLNTHRKQVNTRRSEQHQTGPYKEIANMIKATGDCLILNGRRTCPYNILWVGLKDVNAVVEFYNWFRDKYSLLQIIIHVVEDIVDIVLPEDSELAMNILFHKEDFMSFNMTTLFDMMFMSVKDSLSDIMKLKFFSFAAIHYRRQQPLFIVGRAILFQIPCLEESASKKSKKTKPILPSKVTEVKRIPHSRWSFVSVVGDEVWGSILSDDNTSALLSEFDRRITHERNRSFHPHHDCTPFREIFVPGMNKLVLSIMFMNRPLRIKFSDTFVRCLDKIMQLSQCEIRHELISTLYYQVCVI
jgi:hypothetical protein